MALGIDSELAHLTEDPNASAPVTFDAVFDGDDILESQKAASQVQRVASSGNLRSPTIGGSQLGLSFGSSSEESAPASSPVRHHRTLSGSSSRKSISQLCSV